MTTLHGKEIKVGDKVWNSLRGWVEVKYITDGNWPIKTSEMSYDNKGFSSYSSKFPSLFWQEFTIPAHAFEKPKDKVKKYLVLYEYGGLYHTTATNTLGTYYSSKEDYLSINTDRYKKFISLIMESEIEVEE